MKKHKRQSEWAFPLVMVVWVVCMVFLFLIWRLDKDTVTPPPDPVSYEEVRP